MVDTIYRNQSADEDDTGSEIYDNVPPVNIQPWASPRPLRCVLSRVLSAVIPTPRNGEDMQAYLPCYRTLPVLSGIIVPFAILLEIPGITSKWYTQTDGSTEPNPLSLSIGIVLSICCAVLANICLAIRFLERRVKTMTILCVVFLSIHDMINITVLATFGATNNGYSLGLPFWLTICSTIASALTNVTLIIDLVRIPNFKQSGSGLTRRQRSLVIIIIGFFCYLALGALVNSLLLDLSFVDGLYFTVVTIGSIGFGDIVPKSRSSITFVCFYAALGVINFAFVVGHVRETVLEGLDFGYRRRIMTIKERRRVATFRRRAENRWRHAVIWRLRERRAPVWIPNNNDDQESLWSKLSSFVWNVEWEFRFAAKGTTRKIRRRHGTKLNLWALPQCQLEAAALEAGVPLDSLLPEGFYDTYDQETCNHSAGVEHPTLPPWFVVHPIYHSPTLSTVPLTHRRLGAMAVMLSNLSFAVYHSSGTSLPGVQDKQDNLAAQDSSQSVIPNFLDDPGDYRKAVANTEKKAYITRSGLSWAWFLVYWTGGAAIFHASEGWSYWSSVYFCFISFSTIGYGDFAPVTPLGRAIFVVWALIGVVTITIFISVVSEAYTSRYKGILGHDSLNHVVKRYHSRTDVELSEKMQHVGTKVRFFLDDTVEREVIDVVENELPSISGSVDNIPTLPIASRSQRPRTQESFERLPQQILTATRSIQQHMELTSDFDKRSADVERFVDLAVWDLLDEVMGEQKLTKSTKMDLLNDAESRQTLMALGIKRSLKELMGISEQAIEAIRQLNRLGVASSQLPQEEDEAEIDWSSGTAWT